MTSQYRINWNLGDLNLLRTNITVLNTCRVWHADRGRLRLRTFGPVPLGLAYFLLVETNPFPNLSLFYRTMLFEYPSVLSRFCLIAIFSHSMHQSPRMNAMLDFICINITFEILHVYETKIWCAKFIALLREKGRDLMQSHDKSSYTKWKSKKQRDNTKRQQKLRLHNDCAPT